MRKQIIVCVLFLAAGFWWSLHPIGQTQRAYAQALPTVTMSAPTPSPTVVPTAIPTATAIPQELLIGTYTEVLKASKDAVAEVHQTANDILTLIGVIFVALSLVGIGGTWLLSSYAQRASDRASNAQQEATKSHEVVQQIYNRSREIEVRNDKAARDIEELNKHMAAILAQIDSARSELETLRTSLAQTRSDNERDRQAIKRPLALMQIDDYAMRLFSDDGVHKANSLLALLEMSTRDDAIVRRRCAKVFGALGTYNDKVAARLKEMMTSDKAGGVRLEAEEALNHLQSKQSYQVN